MGSFLSSMYMQITKYLHIRTNTKICGCAIDIIHHAIKSSHLLDRWLCFINYTNTLDSPVLLLTGTQYTLDPNMHIRFLEGTSFQIPFGPSRYWMESYLWQAEAPKRCLDVLFSGEYTVPTSFCPEPPQKKLSLTTSSGFSQPILDIYIEPFIQSTCSFLCPFLCPLNWLCYCMCSESYRDENTHFQSFT